MGLEAKWGAAHKWLEFGLLHHLQSYIFPGYVNIYILYVCIYYIHIHMHIYIYVFRCVDILAIQGISWVYRYILFLEELRCICLLGGDSNPNMKRGLKCFKFFSTKVDLAGECH